MPYRRILPAALLFLCALGFPASAGDLAGVGDKVPDHAFDLLWNHDGRTRLSDLYGQPVILAGFRRHFQTGLHASWYVDELLRRHKRDGIVAILLDTQKWDEKLRGVHTRSFWLRFFTTAPWLSVAPPQQSLPIRREGGKWTDRSLVLIGVDGRLVLEGEVEPLQEKVRRGTYKARFADALEAEIARRKHGWGKDPGVRRVRKLLFGKGHFAQAWRALSSLDASEVPEVTTVRGELDHALEVAIRAVRRLLDDGRYDDAKERFEDLQKSVRGIEDLAKRVAPLEEALSSDTFEAGRKAERELLGMLRPIAKRQFDKFGFEDLQHIREFAKAHEGQPIGRRARHASLLVKSILAAANGIPWAKFEARYDKETAHG